ncbi:putative fatty acyl-CoA reductase CG5065 [Colletes latitarsis]|uniref:putative fatty acyl-CoA reductase CG5065 n=1 Tax=Colletes latitarsis TaxID=2605962 RepID=UPI004035E3E9
MSSNMASINAQTMLDENDETYKNGNSIDAFFTDSVVLLTGATGFLGKALLEKLLRSCPHLSSIYILLRPKKGKTIEQRFREMQKDPVFGRLRVVNPNAINKVRPVKGDVSLPYLGLSPEDRIMLTQRVNIVFHSAATVRFDEPLKVAVNLNTKGTDHVIDLCKDMTNLVSIVYVSTAYSNANRHEINESIYTTRLKPSTVIDMCDNLDDKTLNTLEKSILEGHPNTYTFTKNLAEQVIWTKAVNLPISIVRPSIVGAAQKEPFPGWLDNCTGISGVILEVARGTVRLIKCNAKRAIDIVPVDYVIDTIICASWHSTIQQNNNKSIKVYNCTSSADCLRWGFLAQLVEKYAIESPSKYIVWYPGVMTSTNAFMYKFITITLHFFPAIVVDFVSRLVGNKPLMMKAAKRFDRTISAAQYFGMNEWKFHRNNMDDLTKKVKTLKDSSNFITDTDNLDWNTYIHTYVLGVRKYILNENVESSSTFRKRLLILYWIHRLTQVSSIVTLVAMIKCISY